MTMAVGQPRGATLLSWSGGKDSAMALHALRTSGVEPVGLLTTFVAPSGVVSSHGVRRELLVAQAAAVGVPVVPVELPDPCPDTVYAERMRGALATVDRLAAVAFGDLFLADLKAWREARVAELGLDAVFPLWGRDTTELARWFLEVGFAATVCVVDTDQLDASFVGRSYDAAFLDDLPAGVDPCGEHGEFHTFVTAGPVMTAPLPITVRPLPVTGRFATAELTPR
jgi:uncharacterized protein (TIGR00290 family)